MLVGIRGINYVALFLVCGIVPNHDVAAQPNASLAPASDQAAAFDKADRRGFVFTPDGRTVAREIDAFDAMRALVLADTGVVHIASPEHTVPSMSEFMVANGLHDRGRQVVIDMLDDSAMHVGEGSSAAWLHTPHHN